MKSSESQFRSLEFRDKQIEQEEDEDGMKMKMNKK